MARTIFQPGQPIDPAEATAFAESVGEALRQLRLALGSGQIFHGFDVRQRSEGIVDVLPGLAFDGAGESIALEQPLPVPIPAEGGPLWLCLRHHPLVDESDEAGHPLRERDSVLVEWLPEPPPDDRSVPLARLVRGERGWQVDRSVARRAPPLSHRHTGSTLPDRSGRLRFDGAPVRLAAPGGEEGVAKVAGLEAATAAEFRKVHALIETLFSQQEQLALEVETAREEVAEAAERAGGTPDEGWRDALRALREELALTMGEELREELEVLRAEVTSLAARPAGVGADLGSYTPVTALHGVGAKSAEKLAEAGVNTVSELLAATATPEARGRLEEAGLSLAALQRWSRQADLLRLHGAGYGEVELLQTAGIASTAQLATEEAAPLFARLRDAANARGDVAAPPLAWVESWIEQARRLPPVVVW